MRILRYFSIFFVLGYAAWYFYAGDKPYQSISGQTMGTYYNVKIRTRKEDNMLPQKIRQRLDELNREMSVFDSESEISRLNNAKAGEWIDLSPEMSKVMKDSAKIWRLSGGAFDPTVGRLVDLWGFGASVPKKAPSEAEIKEVLKYTGFDKLKFADGYSRVKKSNDNIYINLSAIAKGYGVDRVAEKLEELGIRDYVVEIGGEVRAAGRKSEDVDRGSRSEEEKGWKIGVVKPSETPETAFVADLRNAAVATSGDYRNYYYKDGKKYSHTISPKSGYPVEHNLASVTVFDDNCMDADALATAAMSMGETKALKFAADNNLALVMFVREEDGSLKTLVSDKARKILGE